MLLQCNCVLIDIVYYIYILDDFIQLRSITSLRSFILYIVLKLNISCQIIINKINRSQGKWCAIIYF